MPELAHILFPVDFSRQCEAAAPRVQAMAAAFGARVTMLYAIDAADFLAAAGELGGYVESDLYRRYKQDSTRRLAGFLSQELPGAARHLAEGEAGQRITAFAAEHAVHLIMMPTHGLGVFRRLLIGSVTAKVLHDAACPVWTGVHLEGEPGPAGGVFCAVDLGPQSAAALRWAVEIAAKERAPLTIVHTVPSVDSRPGKYFDADLHSELRRQARQELEALRTGVNAADAEILLVDGEPAAAIRAAALERRPDLLVIARGSAAEGFGRLRKHAYDIIRQVPCPTVSV